MLIWRGAKNAKKVAQTRDIKTVGCVVTLQSLLQWNYDAYFVILAP